MACSDRSFPTDVNIDLHQPRKDIRAAKWIEFACLELLFARAIQTFMPSSKGLSDWSHQFHSDSSDLHPFAQIFNRGQSRIDFKADIKLDFETNNYAGPCALDQRNFVSL